MTKARQLYIEEQLDSVKDELDTLFEKRFSKKTKLDMAQELVAYINLHFTEPNS